MTTLKTVVLSAISAHGTARVRENAKKLAHELFCSKSHILKIVRDVEKGNIIIQR